MNPVSDRAYHRVPGRPRQQPRCAPRGRRPRATRTVLALTAAVMTATGALAGCDGTPVPARLCGQTPVLRCLKKLLRSHGIPAAAAPPDTAHTPPAADAEPPGREP
ncbi:hypothetical protein [Amycolatopsis sp. AA4]|uniref:hypothetical protein n=1 Tax=Amycolatopsis sp. AA4 TaxID=1896961 RepID=UPI0001B55C17|nr:hypothetical protein [Amycolatopsis sp. AA4]